MVSQADDELALVALRHSCAHLLAEAVRERFAPDGPVRLAGGPPIKDGFYYDFALPRRLGDEDLAWLDARLKELIARPVAFRRRELSEAEARALFADEPYKLAFLEQAEQPLTVYQQAGFVDLCEGPHVASTGAIDPEAVRLLSVAGAYWRGDESQPMLTRIYGTAWPSAAELEAYLARRADAERRDHRALGRDLELFFFHPTAPGMPYWLPNGLIVLNELLAYWRLEHAKRGYQEIASPLLNEKSLWETSGHWEHYHDDMFLMEMENGQVYGLKPMNCPNAMLVFNHRQRSYRDLPLRLSDCDILHRHERSGSLHGMLRVQKFQQDDAHIFVAEEEIDAEFERVLELVRAFYQLFGLRYEFRLAARPAGFLGDAASWDRAEAALRRILDRHAGPGAYTVAEGEGAFYGPKIDILVHDALERVWQLGTVQLDFQLPRRFGCVYTDRDGAAKTPVVIHRVIYGSLERFIGVLLEHSGGALPVWLAPLQVWLLPVDSRHAAYAAKAADELRAAGLRVAVQEGGTLSARIREAAVGKVPYVLVAGDREVEAGAWALRLRGGKSAGSLSLSEFTERALQAIKQRELEG